MSVSLDFFRKYAWVPYVILILFFFLGVALDMKKTGLILGTSFVVSLIVIMLIPAVLYGELNVRGNIFSREKNPLAFYVVFCIFAALGIAIVSIITWILVTWNI